MSKLENEKKVFTPDEIQKEFEDFAQQKFGGSVKFMGPEVSNFGLPPKEEQIEKKPLNLNFNYKPKEIKEYLDQYVIQQDEAKKVLSIAVCDHYNHVRTCYERENDDKDYNYSKQNVLLLGPTGVGKTYLIRMIAEKIGVPFVKADATRFTEMGYVGANVDDLIKDLVVQAEDDLENAQFGIIYLDEADKLAATSSAGGKDVSGRGVQIGLLKLMEETEVDLRGGNDPASQMQAFMEMQTKGKVEKKVVNTRHILFMISGAFNGLTEIIQKRLNEKTMGIGGSLSSQGEAKDYLKFTTTQDLVDYGFEPEFVGRLPVRVSCQNLTKEDLFEIMRNSKGSIIRQYEESFKSYGIDVVFTDEALVAIAAQAEKEKTGARGLMTICEQILRDYKFELPSTKVSELVIDKEVVENPKESLKKILKDQKEHKYALTKEKVHRFERQFASEHDLKISFNEEAIEMIYKKCSTENLSPEEYCVEILSGYEHGLKLIRQNTNQDEFFLTSQVLEHPKETLEEWIRQSYADK